MDKDLGGLTNLIPKIHCRVVDAVPVVPIKNLGANCYGTAAADQGLLDACPFLFLCSNNSSFGKL